MITDEITWGESYDIAAQAGDAAGEPITMDGTWSAALRITRQLLGGETVVDLPMPIVDGAAQISLDTGEEGWAPGTYIYDTRLTDPDGYDYWSEPVKLVLRNRNTPPSA